MSVLEQPLTDVIDVSSVLAFGTFDVVLPPGDLFGADFTTLLHLQVSFVFEDFFLLNIQYRKD
jgi:hypothetical protein